MAHVMVNCMCQLDQAMEPKYLVKDYSRCFWEGTFQMRLTFKSDFNKADYPPQYEEVSSSEFTEED